MLSSVITPICWYNLLVLGQQAQVRNDYWMGSFYKGYWYCVELLAVMR